MGNGTSKQEELYNELVRDSQVVIGGTCPCLIAGGNKKKYGGSEPNISTLEALIVDLASELSKFGIDKINPKDKSIAQVIENIKQYLPPTGSLYNRLSSDPDKLKNAIEKIKSVINKYVPNSISGTTVAEIMNQADALLRKWITALYENILRLQNQAETTQRIILDLIALMNNMTKIDINKLTDAARVQFQSVLAAILKELNNIFIRNQEVLHAFQPDKDKATELVAQTSSIEETVKRLKASAIAPDTKAAVSFLLAQLQTSLLMAAHLQRMLEVLGIKQEEYAKSTNMEELRNLLAAKVLDKIPTTPDELRNITQAIDFLESQGMSLSPKQGGSEGTDENILGGTELEYIPVNKQAINLFIHANLIKLTEPFRRIHDAVDKLVDRFVDAGITNTQGLKACVIVLELVPDINVDNILQVFSLPTTPELQQEQTTITMILEQLVTEFSNLSRDNVPGATKNILEEIIMNIKEVIKIITELSIQLKEKREKIGGAIFTADYSIMEAIKDLSRIRKKLLHKLKYLSFIITFKQSVEGLKTQATKYPETLGRFIARLMDEEAKVHNSYLNSFKTILETIDTNIQKDNEPTITKYKEHLDLVHKTKIDMLQVIEAHELSLLKTETSMRESLSFTQIKEIEDLFKIIEIIPTTLTDKTPYYIARTYESVPSTQIAGVKYYSNIDKWILSELNYPYQVIVASACHYVHPNYVNQLADIGPAIHNKFTADSVNVGFKIQAPKANVIPPDNAITTKLVGCPLFNMPIVDYTNNKKDILAALKDNITNIWKMPLIKNFIAIYYMLLDYINPTKEKDKEPLSRRVIFDRINKYLILSCITTVDNRVNNLEYQADSNILPSTLPYYTNASTVAPDIVNNVVSASNLGAQFTPLQAYDNNIIRFSTDLDNNQFSSRKSDNEKYTDIRIQKITNVMLRMIPTMAFNIVGPGPLVLARPTPAQIAGPTNKDHIRSLYESVDPLFIRFIKSISIMCLNVIYLNSLKDDRFVDQLRFGSEFRQIVGGAEKVETIETIEYEDKFIELVIRGSLLVEFIDRMLQIENAPELQFICRPLPGSLLYRIYYMYKWRKHSDGSFSDTVMKIMINSWYEIYTQFPSYNIQQLLEFVTNELNKSCFLASKEYIEGEEKEIRERLTTTSLFDKDFEYERYHKTIDQSTMGNLTIFPSQTFTKEIDLNNLFKKRREKKYPEITIEAYDSIYKPYIERYMTCLLYTSPSPRD